LSAKKRKKSRKKAGRQPPELPDQLETGMPARDSIRKVVDAVSPQGAPFKILKTTETDVYDKPPVRKKKRRPKS